MGGVSWKGPIDTAWIDHLVIIRGWVLQFEQQMKESERSFDVKVDFTCSLNIKSPGAMSVVATMHLKTYHMKKCKKAKHFISLFISYTSTIYF